MRTKNWVLFREFECYFAVEYINGESNLLASPILLNGSRDQDPNAEIEVDTMHPDVAIAVDSVFGTRFYLDKSRHASFVLRKAF